MKDIKLGLIAGSGIANRLGGIGKLSGQVSGATILGPASSSIFVYEVNGVQVYVIKRHGQFHQYAPHEVPYKQNILALKKAGVTHLLTTGACGVLEPSLPLAEPLLCTSVIDLTKHRRSTFFEEHEPVFSGDVFGEERQKMPVVHVNLDPPICTLMLEWLCQTNPHLAAYQESYVCIEGPQFSTMAESIFYSGFGSLVGMTAMPELKLAREAEIPTMLIALPTDYDVYAQAIIDGKVVEPEAGQAGKTYVRATTANVDKTAEISKNMQANVDKFLSILQQATLNVEILQQESLVESALKGAVWTSREKWCRSSQPLVKALLGPYMDQIEETE